MPHLDSAMGITYTCINKSSPEKRAPQTCRVPSALSHRVDCAANVIDNVEIYEQHENFRLCRPPGLSRSIGRGTQLHSRRQARAAGHHLAPFPFATLISNYLAVVGTQSDSDSDSGVKMCRNNCSGMI